MRYILTMLIAFHWMAVFAMLAVVSTIDAAARDIAGAAPARRHALAWRCSQAGGGPLAAAFAGLRIRRGEPAVPVDLADGGIGRRLLWAASPKRSRAVPSAVASACLSLLLIGGALLPVSGLFVTSAIALAALLSVLSRGLRRALGDFVPFRTRRCRSARCRARDGGRRCPQRDADQAFRPRQCSEAQRGAP